MKNITKSVARRFAFLTALLLAVVLAGTVQSFAADTCSKNYPTPIIKFDHKDSDGRIYIPVSNYSDYKDLMGYNATVGGHRTYVYIYDASTHKYAYSFLALPTCQDLQGIWVSSKIISNRSVYIVLKDRLCKKDYQSNTVTWPTL